MWIVAKYEILPTFEHLGYYPTKAWPLGISQSQYSIVQQCDLPLEISKEWNARVTMGRLRLVSYGAFLWRPRATDWDCTRERSQPVSWLIFWFSWMFGPHFTSLVSKVSWLLGLDPTSGCFVLTEIIRAQKWRPEPVFSCGDHAQHFLQRWQLGVRECPKNGALGPCLSFSPFPTKAVSDSKC